MAEHTRRRRDIAGAVALVLAFGTGVRPGFAQTRPVDDDVVIAAAALADGPRLEALLADSEDIGLKSLVRTWLASAAMDDEAAMSAFEAYRHSDAVTPARTTWGWSVLAGAEFASGDYHDAAEAATSWTEGLIDEDDASERLSAAQTLGVARMLAGAPAQRLEVSAPQPAITTLDAAGLVRAPTTINGHRLSAVLDTGANLSVLSATAAARLGVTMLDGSASVGSATQVAVPVRIGVADRVVIAGATLRNVAFLVIDDSGLTFPLPGGYKIDAIVGFPIFEALGRTTFHKDGRLTWEMAGGSPSSPNLYARGNNLYAVVEIGGEHLPLHLDTGAGHSNLSSAASARISLDNETQTETRRTAGAGGSRESTVRLLSSVSLTIDGRPACHAGLPVDVDVDGKGDATSFGTLGQDVLRVFESYTLDLRRMRLELGAPATGAGKVRAGACPA